MSEPITGDPTSARATELLLDLDMLATTTRLVISRVVRALEAAGLDVDESAGIAGPIYDLEEDDIVSELIVRRFQQPPTH